MHRKAMKMCKGKKAQIVTLELFDTAEEIRKLCNEAVQVRRTKGSSATMTYTIAQRFLFIPSDYQK